MFAFARDGGIPHKLHIMDNRFKSPIRTIVFGATCSFLLALPILGSEVAFEGTVSIATIGLYISYGIPIAMTLFNPRSFKRGPFRLGRASKPIALVACAWVGLSLFLFSSCSRCRGSTHCGNLSPQRNVPPTEFHACPRLHHH